MLSLLILASVFVVGTLAARLGPTSENWRDYTWSYEPEKTADYYQEYGLEQPALAAPITVGKPLESYIVKLECLGCPFRVRELGQVYERWQEPPQANSLVSFETRPL